MSGDELLDEAIANVYRPRHAAPGVAARARSYRPRHAHKAER